MFLFSVLIGMTALFSGPHAQAGENPSYMQDLPFEMPAIREPVIPDRTVSLEAFGGRGDGITLNTDAFSEAIRHLASLGGGRLVVPAGVWLTGPVSLSSHIELHLDEGSIVLFSADKSLYPIVETVFEGVETKRCQPQLSAVGQHDIAVTGKGIIDGGGAPWRQGRRSEMSPGEWDALLRQGGVLSEDGQTWYPSASYARGAGGAVQNIVPWAQTQEDFESIRDFLRPVMVHIRDCDNVLLEDVIFQNSPCWNVHLCLSRNLRVRRISVRSPWNAKNSDGLDIESCTNVFVGGSSFDVGDDAICIKSGKDEAGRRRGIPAANIVVDHCICFHGHGGFVVGSEMSGGVRNIAVSDCLFSGTETGLRFKSKRGRGGIVENVFIRNIRMNDIKQEAILLDLFYGRGWLPESPARDTADESTPQFRDIYISGVVCNGAGKALLINGLPEMPIRNITISNCSIEALEGARIEEAEHIRLDHMAILARKGAPLVQNHVDFLEILE